MSAVDPGLREELLGMAQVDQDARQRLDCHPRLASGMSEQELTAAERVRAVDAANTARMKTVVAERGWPGRSLVGDHGAQAAWLLVQHADHDPAFQRACLELLGQAVQAGEADPSHHAYLTLRLDHQQHRGCDDHQDTAAKGDGHHCLGHHRDQEGALPGIGKSWDDGVKMTLLSLVRDAPRSSSTTGGTGGDQTVVIEATLAYGTAGHKAKAVTDSGKGYRGIRPSRLGPTGRAEGRFAFAVPRGRATHLVFTGRPAIGYQPQTWSFPDP